MFRLLAACALAAGLAGCVSPQQQMAADDTACRQMGARPGSDIYVQCRMFKQQQRAQADADADDNLALGLAMMGGGYSAPATTRLQTTCHSSRMGNFVNTHCF